MSIKASIFVFSLGACLSAVAQLPQVPPADRLAQPMPQKSVAGVENPSSSTSPPPGMSNQFNPSAEAGVLSCVEATFLGYTQYDLQSNSSIDNRLIADESGVLATWTLSLELSPFSDRGTGFNKSDEEGWGQMPYERIESIRTGWSSVGVTAAGRQAVISHASIADPLQMAWRDEGDEIWSEASVPSELEVGKLWPRMATGGVDGNSLHVICITTPIANGGMLHNNQDGALLYYRSPDGGNSWDIIDYSFAELDSANFFGFDGDAYAIHARGDMVAFAVFNDFSDSFVMISQDNGDTWEKQLLVDFPVDLYEIDAGLPEGEAFAEDYNGDGLFQEYFNSDGAGAVHVDQFGQVHVSYGSMYYMDADTIDGTTSYFPGTNGLVYWNESMGPDSAQIIGYSYDYDENETLDFDEIALYYVGCASYPSIGSDAAGNLYVTYSAIMENFSNGVQNYRHQFLVHSTDGGVSWNADDALDLTPDENFDLIEAVFGCMAPDVVNGEINITYQRDFEPGLHVRGDEDPSDINDIIHLRIPIELLDDFDLCEAGCTDPAACNYNEQAATNDGSCEYLSCGAVCADTAAVNYWSFGECCYANATYSDLLLNQTWRWADTAALSIGTAPGEGDLYEADGTELPATQTDDRWTFFSNGGFQYDSQGQVIDAYSGFYGEMNLTFEMGGFVLLEGTGTNGVDQLLLLNGAGGYPCPFIGLMDTGPLYDIISLTNSSLVLASQNTDPNCQPVADVYTTISLVVDSTYVSASDGVCDWGCVDAVASNFDSGAQFDNALCTYDLNTLTCTTIGHPAWAEGEMGLYPELSQAMVGVLWTGEWVFNVPAQLLEPTSGINYGIHHVDWTQLDGMPEWVDELAYEMGELSGNSQHCISAVGVPTAVGFHEVEASGEVFLSIFGQPFSVGEQSFSAWLEVMENPNPIPGCTYPLANNYLSYATLDDGGCEYWGCTDANASNFNPFANVDDGSCGEACDPTNDSTCQADNDGNGIVTVADLLILLGEFGSVCE